ncbi:MAG TPA: TIGR03560 family F420-dependent LLM class oxidoreductase [Solirubrobacterales bacterium]|jgi:F420-dependent oxidoreductase-like protein|nr:TIGR03560 family F420-dependent LLM class oxidoreductase [Solirubrobacterales bacterium]
MDVCLMIEGQEDVNWADWKAIAAACEEHGVGKLFRSDHYLSVDDRRERGSLDAWTTIAALAAITERLRLGTLVSPATFRHPAILAKMAVTADHVSGGRVELGIGAGWWEREHEAYGFDLPEPGPRLDALEEQMELIRRYWEEGAFNYEGRHYRAKNLDPLPRPMQQPRLPLILGGKGGPRSLRLAAALADEYNTVMSTAEEIADVRKRLDETCEAIDRDPASLPLSMMTGWLVGSDRDDLRDRAANLARWKGEGEDGDAFLADVRESTICGTVSEAIEQLQALEAAGLSRIMGQHLLHRDLDAIELLGREIVPALA